MPLFSGGHAPVVQRLLELPQGTIDFSVVNNKGHTGMDVAKGKGHTAILKMFANAGHCEIVFWIACKEGKEDDLRKTLLEREDIVKSCGAKEFREACKNGNEVTAKWFLQECQGLVDFNKPTSNGSTAFALACWEGHIGVVNLLLEQPSGMIDIKAKHNYWGNCFIIACHCKFIL